MNRAHLSIRKACEHNLKDLDLDIPHGCLVAFSGVSGSGKSSLAFDTIYAEARRRFLLTLESLPPAAVRGLRRPKVEEITGLAPAIAIDQDRGRQSPRSTVASLAGLYDFLRALYARVGQPLCLTCGSPVNCHRFEEVYETVCGLPEGTRILVLAPRRVGGHGEREGKEFLESVDRSGYRRLRIDGEVRLLEEVDAGDLADRRVEVVVDRLAVKGDTTRRVKGSLQAALEVGDGQVGFLCVDIGEEERFSVRPACSSCGSPFRAVTPALFSFNSQHGACPACRGLGTERGLRFEGVFSASDDTLDEALGPLWREFGHTGLREKLNEFCRRRELNFESPPRGWPPPLADKMWRGEGRRSGFTGLRRCLEKLSAKAEEEELAWLEELMADEVCGACRGTRLCPEALAVRIGDYTIATLSELPVGAALEAVSAMRFEGAQGEVGEAVAAQVSQRLATLTDLGLAYLPLGRGADTLSSGEFQRARLAAALGSGMTHLLYVLDEPTVGLHPRDTDRLAGALRALVDAGNSVIVVEHDPAIIERADFAVDLGPGAGENGGHVVASGTPEEVAASGSPTGKYLGGAAAPMPASQGRRGSGVWLEVLGACGHNLKDVDVAVPLGCLVCVTGVSGSGKTSLIRGTVYPILAARLQRGETRPLPFRECRGTEFLERVIAVDQRPMGRTSRSNTATYTGLLTDIRRLFAELPEAKVRGYGPGQFSFNAPEGACPECGGSGVTGVRRGILEEIQLTCPTCEGSRYRGEVLQVRYRHKSIAEVLDLSAGEAVQFFDPVPSLARRLALLVEMGLGYLCLGQPASSLSGGEAQRVKLCGELSRPQQARSLYILDEPTVGLHLDDIHYLVLLLQRLVDSGNSVLVVEHNIELVAAADHIIDLGPEAGADGGEVVATGAPRDVAAASASHTGQYLQRYLNR